MRVVKVLVIVVVVGWLFALFARNTPKTALTTSAVSAPRTPTVQKANSTRTVKAAFTAASTILQRCGKPDVDDSTQYDVPRPPIVTRWFVYNAANVRFMFAPDAKGVAPPPPYRGWILMGYYDASGVISPAEASRRLGCDLTDLHPHTPK